MKRLLRIVCLLAAVSILGPSAAQAQYYGANGTTWNNPMSASASRIIQSRMDRRRLENRLARNRSSRLSKRKPTRRSRTSGRSARRSSRRAR